VAEPFDTSNTYQRKDGTWMYRKANARELFDQIIGQTAAPASLGLSQREIFGLFNLRTPQGAIKSAA